MDKKRKVKIDSQTQSQEAYSVDFEQKATAATENIFTKDDFLGFLDKVILTDKTEEKSATGRKKASE
jgi:hypothetical protein